MMSIPVVGVFLIALVVPFCAAPPACLVAFVATATIVFPTGSSRRVYDPIAGIGRSASLSPKSFDAWARVVCLDEGYERLFLRFIYAKDRAYDEKLALLGAQIKAILHVFIWKSLTVFLAPLILFQVIDTFWGDLIWKAPIVFGVVMGVLWGFSLGIYWRAYNSRESREAA